MRILTGIQASGQLHVGNYFGAIKPAIELQNQEGNECVYFIADLHAFTSLKDGKKFKQYQKDAFMDWLALGLDPEKSVFFCQSDVRAHAELMWYLMTFTPMGLLERAHSYKDKKAKGLDTNAGLFTYPVLMAADILLYDIDRVPVGKDQKQHVEMARDIAQKMNHHFDSDLFVLPEYFDQKSVATVPGLDGAKMSKSYGNTIPIFGGESEIRKKIMSIQTESINLGDPIDPKNCNVFAFHRLFGNPNLEDLRAKYLAGDIGFGDSKKMLFELVWEFFAEAREKRKVLETNKDEVEKIMEEGAVKASKIAGKKLEKVRKKFGLRGRSFGF